MLNISGRVSITVDLPPSSLLIPATKYLPYPCQLGSGSDTFPRGEKMQRSKRKLLT